MTMVQMPPRSMAATPVPRSAAAAPILRTAADTSVPRAAGDIMDTAGPRVFDDMTVEVALSVMASARTGHLLVCDNDGVCSGLLTRAQLTTVRDSSGYTDRVQLRDILADDTLGPLTLGRWPHVRDAIPGRP
ncbi:CBS domain-containing protein [Streptomyces hundungensis]|uniref:CBS domain-containing protein n=1 Tax=Streptomyces hundungensis TaxID=1077946 RepID=UPI003406A709